MLDLGNYYGVILIMVALIGGCIYLCIHFFVINNKKYKERLLELKAFRERKTVKKEERAMVAKVDDLKKSLILAWRPEPKDWKETEESIGEKEGLSKEDIETLKRLEKQIAERKSKIAEAKASPPIAQRPFYGGSYFRGTSIPPIHGGSSEKDDIDIGFSFQAAEPKVPYGQKPEIVSVVINGKQFYVDVTKLINIPPIDQYLTEGHTPESDKERAQKAIEEIKKNLEG